MESEPAFVARVAEIKRDPARHRELCELLREESAIYDQRPAAAVVRMRGWVLLAFGEIGLPDDAAVFALEELDTGRDPYLVAAATRALRSRPPDPGLAAFAVRAIANIRYKDDAITFDDYGGYAETAGTTAIGELFATLRWLGSYARGVVPDLEAMRGELAAEARSTIEAIQQPPEATAECCALPTGIRTWLSRCAVRSNDEPVTFEDHAGRTVQLAELFAGKPTIVAFFYTRCDNPQKCSLTVTKLARLQAMLRARGLIGQIRIAAITYDPGFDHAERIRAYGESRGLELDDDHRMLRTTAGFDTLRARFGLGVNFIASLVNRHRVEAFTLDREGRVVASFERLKWDEEVVLDRAVAELGRPRPQRPHAWTAFGTLAALAAALFPKCPVCWSAYLSALGIAGVDSIPHSPWLVTVFAALLLINLGSLWLRTRATRRVLGFHVAAAGAVAILVLQRGLDVPYAGSVGIALTIAGSLLATFGKPDLQRDSRLLRQRANRRKLTS